MASQQCMSACSLCRHQICKPHLHASKIREAFERVWNVLSSDASDDDKFNTVQSLIPGTEDGLMFLAETSAFLDRIKHWFRPLPEDTQGEIGALACDYEDAVWSADLKDGSRQLAEHCITGHLIATEMLIKDGSRECGDTFLPSSVFDPISPSKCIKLGKLARISRSNSIDEMESVFHVGCFLENWNLRHVTPAYLMARIPNAIHVLAARFCRVNPHAPVPPLHAISALSNESRGIVEMVRFLMNAPLSDATPLSDPAVAHVMMFVNARNVFVSRMRHSDRLMSIWDELGEEIRIAQALSGASPLQMTQGIAMLIHEAKQIAMRLDFRIDDPKIPALEPFLTQLSLFA